MWKSPYSKRGKYSVIADAAVLVGLGALIFAVLSFGQEWQADFSPITEIRLDFSVLPIYALFSSLRALLAYVLSLAVTLALGYWAAKSPRAEKILIPLLDILQSIPVLGFLPGLVLGLIALFPKSHTGLELAAILMIFTGQVWNMIFAYYASLKSVPNDLREAADVMGWSKWRKWMRLELPFSSVSLAWNSVMSMAGGWFFLSICEAFTLGDQVYRLPGLGAYMAEAISRGDRAAMFGGVVTMILVIVVMDFMIWRPVLGWVYQYRMDSAATLDTGQATVLQLIRQSYLLHWGESFLFGKRRRKWLKKKTVKRIVAAVAEGPQFLREKVVTNPGFSTFTRVASKVLISILAIGLTVVILDKFRRFGLFMITISPETWLSVVKSTLWTLLRVMTALVLGTLWTIPLAIWLGLSPKRLRIAQPITQVVASFPAPMLYPVAVALMSKLGIPFTIGSMVLMMLGVQWYILFNALAGAVKIPRDMQDTFELLEVPRIQIWKRLYLPAVFPSAVTGWMVAAGGAWNASIVAEYMDYDGGRLVAPGLGSAISQAAATGNYQLLVAGLVFMVIVVVGFNRMVWTPLSELAQNRFRVDA